MAESEKETSEFGKGFLYPLALFLAHADRLQYGLYDMPSEDPKIWLYGAGDHLYCLMPEYAPNAEIKAMAESLIEAHNKHRFERSMTKEIGMGMVQTAKDIFLAIDLRNGVPAIKGDYE